MFDWDKIDREDKSSNFKEYAQDGVYTVTVDHVDVHELASGSVAQDFFMTEDDYKYPRITHWISFNNKEWTAKHQRNLMMLLGASKENAQKAVEICESKGEKKKIIAAYQQTFDKLLAKMPSVEIEVWKEEGSKYSEADFTDRSVRMNRPEDGSKNEKKNDEITLDIAEPVEISEDQLPF